MQVGLARRGLKDIETLRLSHDQSPAWAVCHALNGANRRCSVDAFGDAGEHIPVVGAYSSAVRCCEHTTHSPILCCKYRRIERLRPEIPPGAIFLCHAFLIALLLTCKGVLRISRLRPLEVRTVTDDRCLRFHRWGRNGECRWGDRESEETRRNDQTHGVLGEGGGIAYLSLTNCKVQSTGNGGGGAEGTQLRPGLLRAGLNPRPPQCEGTLRVLAAIF